MRCRRAPRLKKTRIGNVEVTALLDTPVLMNPHVFMPKVAEQMIAEYPQLLDGRQLMTMSITTYLLRSAGKNILIDTGLGARKRPFFPQGRLDESLRDAGVDPADIDTVVHTHLHIDHVGWNTVDADDGSRRIFFPNARFVVQQKEWDYWMQPVHMEDPANAHLVECVAPLQSSGRLQLVSGEQPLDEQITFIATPGHTPGHVAIGVYSAGERAVIVGDASHHPVQLDHPDWSPSADVDPVLSARTREGLFEAAESDGRAWIAGHWQYPGFGRILRLNGKRVFKAL